MNERLLIVANHGIGNALMLVPLLKLIEENAPSVRYWCLSNPVFESAAVRAHAGLRGPAGMVPPSWRRFQAADHARILAFASSRGITHIANLRLACQTEDGPYFAFKFRAARQGLICHDLYESGDAIYGQRLTSTLSVATGWFGFPEAPLDSHWLAALRSAPEFGRRLGFYLGASQAKKRWPPERWTALAEDVLRSGLAQELLIFAGQSEEELREAALVMDRASAVLRPHMALVAGLSLDSFLRTIASCTSIVTGDTFVSHLAACIGIPMVTIYHATRSRIWGPSLSPGCRSAELWDPARCAEIRVDGTCRRYYDSCPAPCRYDVTPALVMRHLHDLHSYPATLVSALRQAQPETMAT